MKLELMNQKVGFFLDKKEKKEIEKDVKFFVSPLSMFNRVISVTILKNYQM